MLTPRLSSRAGVVEVLNDRGRPSLTLKSDWHGSYIAVECLDHEFGGHYNPRTSTFTTNSDAISWMQLLAKERLDYLNLLARLVSPHRTPTKALAGRSAVACAVAQAPAPASRPDSYYLPGFAPPGCAGPGSGATGPVRGLYVQVTRKVSVTRVNKQARTA